MDAIILYMLFINGCVAVIALVIAVAQQRFHRRVEANLSKAIEDTKVEMKKEITSIQSGIEQNIEQRMWGMEKRFYDKIEDPDTYGAFIKKLSDHIHARFMTESRGITKKIEGFKDEVRHVAANGGDLADLAAFDWDDDRGLLGNLGKNLPVLSKSLKKNQQGPEPGPSASSPGEGPPSWWDEEDQKAMEKLILEREEHHKVNKAS